MTTDATTLPLADIPAGHVPSRIFLDTNTLQTLLVQGGAVFEGEPIVHGGRTGATPEDIEALAGIFVVGSRAHFELALSRNSLQEVEAAADGRFLQWAFDVLDHWQACIDRPDSFDGWGTALAARLGERQFGYLSAKDAALIRDALAFECDTFLTVERRLPSHAAHLRRQTGLVVCRPPELWNLLIPHLRGL